MSASQVFGVSRQAIILASIVMLHAGAFLLAVAGLGPRLEWLLPVPPPFIYVEARRVPPPPVAPRTPGPLEYDPLPIPMPPVSIPEFEPPQVMQVPGGAAQGDVAAAGPGIPAPELRAPSLRLRDHRLAALVDACYPAASRRLGEEGRVAVLVQVDAYGRAGAFGVAESSGFDRLDAAIACVMRRLEFNPARRDGAAVEASVLLPIVFRLQ